MDLSFPELLFLRMLAETGQLEQATTYEEDDYQEDEDEALAGLFLTGITQAQPPAEYAGNMVPPFLSRLGYIQFYEETMAQRRQRPTLTHVQFTQTMRSYLLHNKAPATTLSLRATMLREVATRVNHIHDDKILFLKTTYDAFREVGMNVLVEDDRGDCIMLSLYNYLASHENPSDFFPVGTYLALLAPLMKHSQDDRSKSLLLRCDNPECVRTFPFYRSWVAAKHGKQMLSEVNDDADVFRKVGNDHFAEGRFETAARMYSRALGSANISESIQITCLCNRAEANLRLERWEAAEMDASKVLSLEPTNAKARFRLAHALLHLNRISEAHELATKLKEGSQLKKNEAFDKLTRDVNQAYEEQHSGNTIMHKWRRSLLTMGSLASTQTIPRPR